MSSSPSSCGICDIRHISKQSDVWSSDCEEGLCTECLEHHSLTKPTRNHTTIPISEYGKLPSYVLEINELCAEHHEKFNVYCKEHERPCCRFCMLEIHIDCKEVTFLENVIKNVKASNMFNEIEQLIEELVKTIGKIRQNREANASAVKEKKILVENEILELRRKIDKHLDKLQEWLMMELTEAEIQVSKDTRKLRISLDEKKKELTEHQTNTINIKKYASDLQTFIAVRKMEKDVETQDTCLQSIVHSDSLNQTKLSYKIDSGLNTMINNIQKFGKIFVESKPCELTFVRKKDKQAQMCVADLSPPMSVTNIQLNLKQKITIKGSRMTGCSFLPEGRMVLSCCNTNTFSSMNNDGVELFQIGASSFDAVYIKDSNSVAVSSGWERNRCITIIDKESQKVMTTISMERAIFGMAVRGRTIYYCAENKALQILGLSDKSVSDIISRHKTYINYVATSGDKLYFTSYGTHTVTCCDLHGTTQWEFTDERVLRGPVGVSVDNDGNVYVVGYQSNNVVVISPDRQHHRQIEKDVETQVMCIQSIFNSDSLNQAELSYKMDTSINTIITSVQKFGEIVVESKPCELTFVRRKVNQAQIMVADLSPPMPVEKIQFKLKQTINIKGKCIGGCSLLPDGRIVMSCFNTNTLRLINKEGEEYFQIGMDTTCACMFDTVYIKDNSVAVSSGQGRNKCITIIDIESKKVIRTIPMYTGVYGMAVRGSEIYYCAFDTRHKIKMLNLSDTSVSDIIISNKCSAFYVATSGDKLYYINRYTDTVTCCNLHGTLPWEFSDKRVLSEPSGISVDNDGNVYVVGYFSSNVVVISPDGQRH